MVGDWGPVPLGSLAADHDGAIAIGPFGSAMKADLYTASGVPVIRGTNIQPGRELGGDWVYIPDEFADAMPRCVVHENDLVFPHRGAIGEVALVPGNRDRYFISTSCMKITLDGEKADPRYAAYYFRSAAGRAEIMRFASQVGTPGIGQPLTSLRQFAIPSPPVKIQRAIADLLSTLEDKIELNRLASTTLEEIAKALFTSWFVDFDPVRARIEGRNIGLHTEMFVLFPDSFEEDGRPKGWPFASISLILEANPSTPLRSGTRVPYVDMAALPTSGPSVSGYILRDASSGSRFRQGDTLVARITPCLENGKTTLVDFLSEKQVGWGSTEFIVLRPKSPMSAAWPYLLARNESFRAHLIGSMTGSSGRQRVPHSAVSAWEMALPPPEILEAFSQAVDPLFDRIRAIAAQSQTLRDLRDTLLPKLISGQLRIKDAEKAVAA